MRGEADTALRVDLPGVLPDNRVITGQRLYGDPFADLTASAAYVRGIVSGLGRDGVGLLRTLSARPELKQLLLIVVVYGGSRTWDDVLFDLLGIQDSTPDHVQFRLLARRVGPDRPANLLWIQPADGGHGHVATGNVGNLLAPARWDSTDAVMCFPLEPAAADALRKWFDNLHARSRGLTPETAAAPRLRSPEGDADGERLWREYLEVLDGCDQESAAEPVIDADTGEIAQAVELTPSKLKAFPQPDPVFLAVQTAMAKGALVSLDRVDRIPPIDVPIRPEMLGEIGTRRVGGASRRVAYRVSLFDEKTQKQLNNRHADASTRLSAFSLMVRDGQRWMPEAAFSLFEQELAASQQKSRNALLAAIGDKPAADVVTTLSEKVARELRELAKQAGVSTTPSDRLLSDVLDDLKQRLETHLGKGAAPGIVRIEAGLSAREDAHYSPWGTVQTFLASAARLPREVISDPFRMRGLVTEAEAFLRAFDLFGDPLVRRYLARERVEKQAKEELVMIEEDIIGNETATPWHRAQALYSLITGAPLADIKQALLRTRPVE